MRRTIVMGLTALVLAPTWAHATVEAGHWSVNTVSDSSNLVGYNTAISIDQTAGGDSTSTFWSYNASTGTIRFVSYNTDEGSTLFLVKPGETVSQDMVLNPGSHQMAIVPVTSGSQATVQVGTDFWLGAATSSLSDPGVTWANVSTRTSFGWAHLQAQADGSLKILSSAMAFREGGIVVGALQAVPEPGTWALMGLGLAGIGLLGRRRAS